MSEITQEFLDELMATQEKLANMCEELEMRICHVNRWEEENIGRKLYREDWVRGQITKVEIKNGEVEIESFGFDDFYEQDKEYWFSCPLDKLLSDDWKEVALKKYKKKQAIIQKEKEEAERIAAQKREERERAEYERLKAKFE